MKSIKVIFAAMLFLSVAAFAKDTKVSDGKGQMYKDNMYEDNVDKMSTNNLIGASHVESLDFKPGHKELSSGEKNELKSLITKTGADRIHEVKVLVWADQEYPAKGDKAPKSSVKLAQKRGKAIKKYLKEWSVADVDLHNMAERPNQIEEFFSTSDSDIKTSAEAKGVSPAKTTGGLFNRTTGHSSTALIFVVTKQDHKNHND